MGQRTNLLLSMENKDGARLNKAYHLQWGYGKVMPVMLLNILSGQYIGVGKEKQNFFASVVPKADDIFELERDFSCFDFTRLEDCQKVLCHCDNNNGSLVLCIKERNAIYRLQDVKYGFLLGPEGLPHNEVPFSRWVTLEEFLTHQPRYKEIDIFFARIINQMMQFFNAESISDAL